MASFNKVILIGNICADPELKQTTSGVPVTSFRIGVSSKIQKDQTDFIDIVAWRKTAEFICTYFKKGDPILVSGAIQTRAYEAQDGSKRKAVEVVADEVSFVQKREQQSVGAIPIAQFAQGQEQSTVQPQFQVNMNQQQNMSHASASADFAEMTPDDDLPF